jgi:exodeoxyribonuclease VIII
MKPGIYPNISFEEYLLAKQINSSSLKIINSKTPAHYFESLNSERKENGALRFGTALHCKILEPDSFDSLYIAMGEINRTTKAGKSAYAELEETGKTILTDIELETIIGISKSIEKVPGLSGILTYGIKELSVFTEDRKCRLDCYNGKFIFDLKTCIDASPHGFSKQIYNYGYHIQAAWYLDTCALAGLDVNAFILIAIEKTAPYAVGIYQIGEESLKLGRYQYQKALEKFKECEVSGKWPGYSQNIETINVPNWALSQDI